MARKMALSEILNLEEMAVDSGNWMTGAEEGAIKAEGEGMYFLLEDSYMFYIGGRGVKGRK